MESHKITMDIKVIFEDAHIAQLKPHNQNQQKPIKNNSTQKCTQANVKLEQNSIQKEIKAYDPTKNSKIELIEQFPIEQCLNYNINIIGIHKPIILQKLLKSLEIQTHLSFQRHKISIYLHKPKMYMKFGNYPLNENVLIRGQNYARDQEMIILAKRRGEISPQCNLIEKKHNQNVTKEQFLPAVNSGMTRFHSFAFTEVSNFYSVDKEYELENERLKQLQENKLQMKKGKKIRQTAEQEEQPKEDDEGFSSPKRMVVLDSDEKEDKFVKVKEYDSNGKKIKTKKHPGRRLNERRIGNVVDKVVQWTRWSEKYRQKWTQLKPSQNLKYNPALSLQEAAKVVAIPKKTLDDYLFHIQFGNENRFNFNEHCMDRFAVLRMFVNKYKKEGKMNPVAIEERNNRDRKVRIKRSIKKRKVGQKTRN